MPYRKRLRAPFASELINFISFLSITIMQIVRIIWYFEIFKPNFDLISDSYINLSIVAESANMISNFDSIITIFIFSCIAKYVMFWITDVALITTTLKHAWGSIRVFMIGSFAALLGFVLFNYTLFGPTMITFSTMFYALPFTLQIFLGSWNENRAQDPYVDPFIFFISMCLFLCWK